MNFLKRTAEEIKSGTAGMTRKQKLRYIWEYYWLPIVGITAGVLFLIYFLYHLLFATKEYWFYVTFVNIRPQTGVESELMEEFVSERGYDLSKKNVFFNDACYFDATSYSGTNNNYYQMFVATVEAGHLDAVVMEEENLVALGSSGRLLDLEAEANAAYFDKYKDRFVYAVPYDEEYSTEPVAVGIDISDSRLMTEYELYDDTCVLGVGAYTQHPEDVVAFLEFIGVE